MNNDVSDLYEQDYYLWLQETYQTLDKKEINRLDFPHLMEEILSLENEQRRKVSGYYAQLSPQLTLGGTGVIPIEDWDDRHVIFRLRAPRIGGLWARRFSAHIIALIKCC
ncbi:DUF29 family protein [Lyngbya sp. CCY1209]|uniref:DUF29 family protein n=1 Tax=Lyngbya sp. CCY1209 TaxID=2886103 RepID=UPI002D1FD592|nr:DUF29 family protein [Lyngbya sp. CCY1209]MEB3886338.1 DUF29 domain-containing protein [Lyngbya sp. CCY1209]